MRRCGDAQLEDLGESLGSEAGSAQPVGVVTAQRVLDQYPSMVHVLH